MSGAQDDIVTMGTFLLSGQEFGVDILQQREVLRIMPITKMPCSVSFIEGVIDLRGTIIPIVNLRERFGMPRRAFDKATRVLTLEVTDTLVVGCIVDSVGQIRRMSRSMIEPAPPVVASVDSEYIQGVGQFGDALLLVLDTAKIFSDEDLHVLAELG